MSIIRVLFDPDHAPDRAIRLALAKHESSLLRDHCHAAKEIVNATGWHKVRVTKAEIRIQIVKGGPWYWLPTPQAISRMIDAHDAGKALRSMTVLIDTNNMRPLPVSPKKTDSRARHDVKPDGTPAPRAPRRRRAGRNSFSRQGFTNPNV